MVRTSSRDKLFWLRTACSIPGLVVSESASSNMPKPTGVVFDSAVQIVRPPASIAIKAIAGIARQAISGKDCQPVAASRRPSSIRARMRVNRNGAVEAASISCSSAAAARKTSLPKRSSCSSFWGFFPNMVPNLRFSVRLAPQTRDDQAARGVTRSYCSGRQKAANLHKFLHDPAQVRPGAMRAYLHFRDRPVGHLGNLRHRKTLDIEQGEHQPVFGAQTRQQLQSQITG